MDEELSELPTVPCSFSRQKKGLVIYIGGSLARIILEKMPLSKDTLCTYLASFDVEQEIVTVQKAKI